MSPQEALQILYNTVRTISLPAQEHEKLRDAVLVLQQAIAPEIEPMPKKPVAKVKKK